MKKTYLTTTIIVLGFFIHCIQAQQIQNNIFIKNLNARQSKDSLFIKFEIDGSRADLKANEKIVLTPIISSESQVFECEPVVISGSTRFKADQRKRFFNNNRRFNSTEPIELENATALFFSQQVAYEPWMDEAALFLRQVIKGCADCSKEDIRDILIAQLIEKQTEPDIRFKVSYVVPETEEVKNRNFEGSAFIDFEVGKSVIIPAFRNNYAELNKIKNVLDELKADGNASIERIILTGFASPEGNALSNGRLSTSRADALKTFLQKSYDFPDNMIKVMPGGEDWTGLKNLVVPLSLPEKEKILEIISSSVADDLKEQKLKSLGSAYSFLLKELFPKLRRVDYRLNYLVRAFTVEEGKVIIKTNPGQMSQNELFLVANSYEKGSPEFKEVFDLAVRLFPDHPIANINAAAIALEEGNTVAAHRYLDKFQNHPSSLNNQGVLYALEGNLDKAGEFFKRARDNGVTEAKENLEKITKIRGTNATQ